MNRRPHCLALCLALSLLATSRPSHACSGEAEGIVSVNTNNPDLPLENFAAGHIGVIPQGGVWGRGFLAASWRMLTAAPLDDVERQGVVRFAHAVYPRVSPAALSPTLATVDPAPSIEPDTSPWFTARAAVVGAQPDGTFANGWEAHYGWTYNCLSDAFRGAAEALAARQVTYRDDPATLRAWIDAQDAVFSNCGGTAGRIPDDTPPGASMAARRDRAYQIAAAHFYAGHHDEAERRFRLIADDHNSPWSDVARYLVVRTITRAAQRGLEAPDRAVLDRAAAEAREVVADASAGPVRDMTRRYQGWLDTLRAGTDRVHTLGVDLTRPAQGDAYADNLRDYALLMRGAQSPFARQPGDPDRLTAWIGVLEGAIPRDVAVTYFAQTHASVWMVAALAAPGDARDARLDAALAAARAVRRDDPAWATAQYHRLRVLAARGRADHAEIVRVMNELTAADGPSARAMFRALAMRAAPDLERFATSAHGVGAGWEEGVGLVLPVSSGSRADLDALTPEAAAVLSFRVPVQTLVRASQSAAFPASVRGDLAEAALLRAVILDDGASVMALAAQRRAWSAERARRLGPLLDATTRDARRLALVRVLLDGAWMTLASPMIDAAPADGDFWSLRCGGPPGPVEPAGFLTAPERTQWRAERARWAALGDGAVFVTNETVRLARVFPRDPAMPAMLAAAVRATRNNGCDAPRAPIHLASRAAFVALHEMYPRSPEARATAYWY